MVITVNFINPFSDKYLKSVAINNNFKELKQC